jgi:hypothetical protein
MLSGQLHVAHLVTLLFIVLQEMQESMNMLQQPGSSMPSMEEMFTNWFGGGSSNKPAVKKPPSKTAKRRDKH